MFIFSYSAVVISLACFGAAAFVFIKKRADAISRYFSAYIFFVGVWVGSNALADFAHSEATLRLWSGMALLGGCFFVSSYLVFVEFFSLEKRLSWSKKIIFFFPSLILAPLGFTSLYVAQTIFPAESPTQVILGATNNTVLLFTIIGMTYGLIRPLLVFKKSTPKKRWQIIYISLGFFATMAGAIIFAILLPALGELRFFTLGSQFAIIAIILNAYAIFRHNLLDIRTVIQRSIIYSILLGLIFMIYISILATSKFVFEENLESASLIAGMLTAIAGTLGAPLLKRWFQKATDSIFFKSKYDQIESLKELSETLNNSLDEVQIIEETTLKLKHIFKSSGVSIAYPSNVKSFSKIEIPATEVVLPIILKGKTTGVIKMDSRLSGDPYSEKDMHLLETFAYLVAVALEKARLYKEARNHAKDLEIKVAERTAQLTDIHERQRRIIMDISHNIQTPLTIAKSEIGLLIEKMPKNKHAGKIDQSIDETSKLIYDILKLTELESPDKEKQKMPIDLAKLIHETTEYLEILAQQKGVRIIKSINLNSIILGDEKKISDVLINVLSNAFKYMGLGHEKIICIRLKSINQEIHLTVQDTGIGIAPEDLSHIFTRFYRAKNPESKEQKGSGLGLSIAKRIVEDHGGRIWASSILGKGTTFTVVFPALSQEALTETPSLSLYTPLCSV